MNEHQRSVIEMVDQYRIVRRRVFEEATMPASGDANEHCQNQRKFQTAVTSVCEAADLAKYGYGAPDPSTWKYADAVWWQLRNKIQFRGIQSYTVATGIRDRQFYFNRFENFFSTDWDIESKGQRLISAGHCAHGLLDQRNLYDDTFFPENIPKLRRTVRLARRFGNAFARGVAPIDYILGGHRPQRLWEIHRRLVHGIGYGDRLTALDFMMDIGLPVVKPDIVLTTLMVHWGWLQSYYDDVPNDLTEADLHGDGHYRGRYRHNAPFMHRRVIGLAKEIAARVSPEVLRGDIGWVASNPLREFALFLNKFAQKRDREFGIERTLFDG